MPEPSNTISQETVLEAPNPFSAVFDILVVAFSGRDPERSRGGIPLPKTLSEAKDLLVSESGKPIPFSQIGTETKPKSPKSLFRNTLI